METLYDISHPGDERASTVVRFGPEGHEAVRFSPHRYAIVNVEYGEVWEQFADEDAAHDRLAEVRREEEGITTDDGIADSVYWVEDQNDREDVPVWFDDLDVSDTYTRTDAWRGYHNVRVGNPAWVEVAGGWVTGYPDETVAHKLPTIHLYEALKAEEIFAPVPLLWTFSVSSNLFSTISDMWVRERDRAALEEWLADVGYPLPVMVEAFK